MKRLFLLSLAVLPFVNTMAQDDDLYFKPDMTGVVEDVQTAPAADRNASRRSSVYVRDNSKLAVYNTNARDEDEYNRRYSSVAGYQTEGGADYSLDYESNDTVFNTDTIYDTDDYAYSRRILRFHSPRVAVALSSPYYWDLVYGYGVYDYLYDAYYDPFFYSWGWGYGWSWGPWSCWYGGLWGWHYPYRWSYWGWGPGWHHGWHGHYAWNHGRYSDRGGFRNRFDRGQSIRTSQLANGGNASRSAGTFSGRSNGIASRSVSSSRSLRGGDGVGLRANNASSARTATGRSVGARSSYADYARSRSVNTPDSRVTNTVTSRTANQNRTSYTRPSSSRSTYTPSRSSYEGGRSVYTPSRSTSSSSSSSRSTYTPSRSSSGSYSSGRSSFGGGRSGGFSGGGGRSGGFGGGGGRGGGGRR